MPSPFPGVDPFIEGQRWKSFHSRLISAIADALVPQVRPRYIVDIEEWVSLEYEAGGSPRFIEPDVAVAGRGPGGQSAGRTAVALESAILTLPIPAEIREHYITLRDRRTQEIVTEIEVLSPTNKRPGSSGRRDYQRKREIVLLSTAHLVELDLLRGGARLPVIGPLPAGDFFALVSRASERPDVAVYAWDLRDPLPEIPVPLADSDPDAVLALQDAFTAAYDRLGLDYALDHGTAVVPPLRPDDADWVRRVLMEARQAA